jgi:hypothetical protein
MRGNYGGLEELAKEVSRRKEKARDFRVSTNLMMMLRDTDLAFGPTQHTMSETAHQQVATRLRIPKAFYDELPSRRPGLRSSIVTELFQAKEEVRTVRILDNKVRAFLSDRFMPYDHYDMLMAALPVLKEMPEVKVKSLTLTEKKMYIQLVFPNQIAEVKVGDVVANGITMTNSEVGLGAWDIQEFMEVLRCTNGMVGTSLMRKYHVGRKTVSEEDGEDTSIFETDTIKADVEAVKLKLRDVIRNSLTTKRFEERVEKIRRASDDRISDSPGKIIERIGRRYELGGLQDELLKNFFRSGEDSRWGLVNAITATARELADQDRAYELERIGNQVVELSAADWKEVTA